MSDGMKTPTTGGGLRKYDGLPPADAAVRAWVTSGIRPEWDARASLEDLAGSHAALFGGATNE